MISNHCHFKCISCNLSPEWIVLSLGNGYSFCWFLPALPITIWGKNRWTCSRSIQQWPKLNTADCDDKLHTESQQVAVGREERAEIQHEQQLQRVKNKHDIRLSIVTAGAGMGSLKTPIPRLQRVPNLSFDTFHACKDCGCCTATV